MRLLLRRDQRSNMLGKITFTLDVRGELTDDELYYIDHYQLGDTELYSSHEMTDPGSGLLGVASRLAFRAMTLRLTVNELTRGKHFESKDVLEVIAIEQHIRQAAQSFRELLDATFQFDGEEVVEI